MSQDQLHIAIEGGSQQQRFLVGSVIEQALEDAGFNDITNDVQSENLTTSSREQTTTLLDVAKAQLPQLFETPITISDEGVAEPEDIDPDTFETSELAALIE